MGNKGKNLYKCEDCQKSIFMYSNHFSKRSGNVCMNCGGRLEPQSFNADVKDCERGDRLSMPTSGSFQRARELNQRL